MPYWPAPASVVAYSVAKNGRVVFAPRRANRDRVLWTGPPRNPLSLDGEGLGQLPPRAVVARRPFRDHPADGSAVDSAPTSAAAASHSGAAAPTPVPSLRRDGGQGPSVTPHTWVDGRGSASLQGQIDGEPASPRDRAVDGCSADSSPRRVESRGRVRHSRSRTPIGRRYRSPWADRESSEPQLILPYEGLGDDGLDTDRG